jgi:hypothetical protein
MLFHLVSTKFHYLIDISNREREGGSSQGWEGLPLRLDSVDLGPSLYSQYSCSLLMSIKSIKE